MTIELLDNVNHASLRIAGGHGARFGDAVNVMPLVPDEFAAAQREYPILFRRSDGGALQPQAVLGFARDTNLFLNGESWMASYIPAVARRGPFSLQDNEGGDPGLLIDLAHPRICRDGEAGLPLFREQGGNAPALEQGLDALRLLHSGLARLGSMDALFSETGIVEEIDLSVTLANGSTVRFDGYLAVAEDALAALDGAALERLGRAGLLGPAFYAAASLANFRRLIALDGARGG